MLVLAFSARKRPNVPPGIVPSTVVSSLFLTEVAHRHFRRNAAPRQPKATRELYPRSTLLTESVQLGIVFRYAEVRRVRSRRAAKLNQDSILGPEVGMLSAECTSAHH